MKISKFTELDRLTYHIEQQIKSSSGLTVHNSVGYPSQRYIAATEDKLLPLTINGADNSPQE